MPPIHCNLQPIHCKPLYYPGGTLHARYIPELQQTISFRSFNLDTDLDRISDWAHRHYSRRYWRLAIGRERIRELYYNLQRNSNAHSFIGCLDEEPICQLDVYRVLADEIQQYIPATVQDCGFHLLMAPNENPRSGLTLHTLNSFLSYYFSFTGTEKMYAEPDTRNQRSNLLLQRAGFCLIQSIQMSYKTANLYCLDKNNFHVS